MSKLFKEIKKEWRRKDKIVITVEFIADLKIKGVFTPKPDFSTFPKTGSGQKVLGFAIYLLSNPKKTLVGPNIRTDLRQEKGGLCFR